ncbi:Y-family DNA polymerase [Consotaella aegiceratis]|uniref:Y-family DNA polymerase n=1 Tax=Consotaella aegiceratis TaxID=3097961 RepID=UPI003D800DB6
MRIVTINRIARDLGVAPGLTLADARARLPQLAAEPMDAAADGRLLQRLAAACDRYTPLVAIEAPDTLMLDITGCAHLFGGEAGLVDAVRRRLDALGIDVHASLAGTPDAARALARFGPDVIVAPGREAEAVDRLPVAALGLADKTATALARAGLKTIGVLSRRPSGPLAARFGEGLVARLRRTLGHEDIGITPGRPSPDRAAEQRFAEPIGHLDDVKATLGLLAARLAVQLEEEGRGSRRLMAEFFRADGALRQIAVETSQPVRDARIMIRLFAERLDGLADPLDPGFGFDRIRLVAVVVQSLDALQVTLDGHGSDTIELATLVDRLGARFGGEAVTRFDPVDTHIPERAVRMIPAGRGAGQEIAWIRPEPGQPPARPLHLFDPPQPIETVAEVPDGPPLRFRWRRVLHAVTRAEGPERIEPEWWRERRPGRDYYRVEDAEGLRFWVFREGRYDQPGGPPRWFLHGIFP